MGKRQRLMFPLVLNEILIDPLCEDDVEDHLEEDPFRITFLSQADRKRRMKGELASHEAPPHMSADSLDDGYVDYLFRAALHANPALPTPSPPPSPPPFPHVC